MAGLNKVQLIGYLGSDPELRYTPAGIAVANFSLATPESWKDKEGVKQEKTEWHKIVVFGKSAEACNNYMKKGKQVYLEGKIQTRKWEDKEGNNRYSTEVLCSNFLFLGKADGGNESPQQQIHKPQQQYQQQSQQTRQPQQQQIQNTVQSPQAPNTQSYGGKQYVQTSIQPDFSVPADDDYPF